jgi:putative aminopeptidase FrvX
MVRISSESGEEKEFISYLKDLFIKELKAKYSTDNYDNLIAKILPKIPLVQNLSSLAFMAIPLNRVKILNLF